MLILPEHLLQLALHASTPNNRSTRDDVLSVGLTAAMLAELRLQGRLQTSVSGHIRLARRPQTPPGFEVLDAAVHVLVGQPAPSRVRDWMALLARELPHLRGTLLEMLTQRGILKPSTEPDTPRSQQSARPRVPTELCTRLHHLLTQPEAHTPPRLGTLIGLIEACDLLPTAFEPHQWDDARARAGWVADRDAIIRATKHVVAQTEGTWN